MNRSKILIIILAFAVGGLVPLAGAGAADSSKINLAVDCHCTDTVGQAFCAEFKNQVTASPGYQLVSNTSGYGIGIHFSCVDLWGGLENQLAGRMAAVSVAFTIYSDKLPGEVYEDSSVFRVGKDATAEMSRKIITAIGQLVTANAVFFKRMRETAASPSPTP